MSSLFQLEYIEASHNGTKIATRYDWKEGYHRPSHGDIWMAVTEMFQSDDKCNCYIRVTDQYRRPCGDLDAEDARKEGDYTIAKGSDHS